MIYWGLDRRTVAIAEQAKPPGKFPRTRGREKANWKANGTPPPAPVGSQQPTLWTRLESIQLLCIKGLEQFRLEKSKDAEVSGEILNLEKGETDTSLTDFCS